MTFLEISVIAIGLAMDAFAVSLAAAASGFASGPRPVFRLSFHFGLFQFMMPVIGWAAGVTVVGYIESAAPWIALGLLCLVGVRMIRSGLHPEDTALKKDPSKGLTMVMLSVATSIDALAVGLSLAMLKVDIWYPSAVIGVITAMLSLAAIALGNRLSPKFGSRMEIIGGLILIAIGLRICAGHLLS